ncbi:olfactory receptor 51I2-like [Dasypus novemcinctus]|uniref:olfactory receptor 51I2-like n=1 Tax=Dasypus novemcinctus TaxID=9361 RepID=UPI0039C99145
MVLYNDSAYRPFLLTGFPGLEASHPVISILFCVLYLIALIGNSAILVVIWVEESLHAPMYLFLSMLAASDLGLCIATLPTLLKLFWFNVREINFDACLIQMFFIHVFSLMESGILLTMAFDRYVAISNPLRYTMILTNATIAKIGVGLVTRAVTVFFPVFFLIKRLKFCKANVLSHSYCLHPDIIKLSCSDHRINSIYGFIILLLTFGMDSVLILLSYLKILITVLHIASQEEQFKALNTCVSHICAVLLVYVPMLGVSIIHRFGKHAPPVVHIIMGYVYLLVPPVLNPVVYCIKTREISTRILEFGHFSVTASNCISTQLSVFLLTGIPGLEDFHIWIAIPFSFMYLLAVLGNGLVMAEVAWDRKCQEPVYLFLAMPAFNDVLLCTVTVPKMLIIFWQGPSPSTFPACLTQMFFVHALFLSESAVLLAMAFDPYVAICAPLHCTTLLIGSLIGKVDWLWLPGVWL